jgi:hypothetical protein
LVLVRSWTDPGTPLDLNECRVLKAESYDLSGGLRVTFLPDKPKENMRLGPQSKLK